MEAGKLVLDDIPFDLRDTLNDLVHMLGARLGKRVWRWNCELTRTCPGP